MKRIVKISVFILLLTTITVGLYHMLSWKDTNGISKLYTYEDDTVDVAFVGSSHVYCTINPALLWESDGIAAINVAEGGQKLSSTYYYIKELLKNQTPKVLFVELWSTAVNDEGLENGNLYRNTINMKFSKDFIENAKEAIKTSDAQESDYDNYLKYITLKFPIIHSRYDDIDKGDFYSYPSDGFYYESNWGSDFYYTPDACFDTDITPLSDYNREWLDKIVTLTKENNIELVFWIAPYVVSETKMEIYNGVKQYALDNSIPFINFNETFESIGFSYEIDMREEGWRGSHVNNYGAEKITRFFSDYIEQNYELINRKGDENYQIYEDNLKLWLIEENNYLLQNEDDLSTYITYLKDYYEYSIIVYNRADIFNNYFGYNQDILKELDENYYYFNMNEDINNSFRLSDSVIFVDTTGYAAGIKLYENGIEAYLKPCELMITTVDKISGELVDIGYFSTSDNGIYRIDK